MLQDNFNQSADTFTKETLADLYRLPRKNIYDFKHYNEDLISLDKIIDIAKPYIEKSKDTVSEIASKVGVKTK
jgi:hypothetical protein